MLRGDLAAARQQWIDEAANDSDLAERKRSSFLAYADESGHVIDFHALRHTFITNLARGGVHPKTAQSLARHSTITLTMDRYSHTVLGIWRRRSTRSPRSRPVNPKPTGYGRQGRTTGPLA